jgi:putative tryptophan/tyrosine transport system substrate-binding protein
LITLAKALTLAHHRWGAEFVTQHRLAMVSEIKEFADMGGLVTHGPNPPDMFRRAATYADKTLSRAKPADVPVEQPTRFELITNLKTAKALDFTIPRLSSSRPTK